MKKTLGLLLALPLILTACPGKKEPVATPSVNEPMVPATPPPTAPADPNAAATPPANSPASDPAQTTVAPAATEGGTAK